MVSLGQESRVFLDTWPGSRWVQDFEGLGFTGTKVLRFREFSRSGVEVQGLALVFSMAYGVLRV